MGMLFNVRSDHFENIKNVTVCRHAECAGRMRLFAEFTGVETARSTPAQSSGTLIPHRGEILDSPDEFLQNLTRRERVIWVQPADGNMTRLKNLHVRYVHRFNLRR